MPPAPAARPRPGVQTQPGGPRPETAGAGCRVRPELPPALRVGLGFTSVRGTPTLIQASKSWGPGLEVMGALPRSGTEQGRAHRGSDVGVRGAPVRFLGLPRPRLGGLERWEVSVRAQEARSLRPSRWRGGFPPKAPGNSPVPPFPAPGLAPVGVSWLIGLCRHMAFFLCVCVHIFFPVWGGCPP